MLHLNKLVFDDYVSAGFGTVSFTTAIDLAETLGRFDQLAIQAIVDDVTSTGVTLPAVTVSIESGCDGEHFSTKSTPIATTSVAFSTTTVLTGFDDGTNPNGYYVRLSLGFSSHQVAQTATAHVRLWVSARDQGGVHVRLGERDYFKRGARWSDLAEQAICKDMCSSGWPKDCGKKCSSCIESCWKGKSPKTEQAMGECAKECSCVTQVGGCKKKPDADL